MTNRLKKPNEQHNRKMIQFKEKLFESILKARNAKKTRKSRKSENKERGECNTTRGEKTEERSCRRAGTETRSALMVYDGEKGEDGKE